MPEEDGEPDDAAPSDPFAAPTLGGAPPRRPAVPTPPPAPTGPPPAADPSPPPAPGSTGEPTTAPTPDSVPGEPPSTTAFAPPTPGGPIKATPASRPTAPTPPPASTSPLVHDDDAPGAPLSPSDRRSERPSEVIPTSPAPLERNRADVDDLLDRLHDDLDMERSDDRTGTALTDPRQLERSSLKARDEIVVEGTGGLDYRPSIAGLGRRAIGYLVDALVVLASIAPGVVLAVVGANLVSIVAGVLLSVVGFVAMAVWYSRAVSSTGTWLGNRVAGTRVVDARNGSLIARGHAVTRFLVRHLFAVFVFPFLSAFRSPQRRTFHDRMVGSLVVDKSREAWDVAEERRRADQG